MLVSSFIFIVLGFYVLTIFKRSNINLLKIFFIIFGIQIILPGVFLPALIKLMPSDAVLDLFFLENTYRSSLGVEMLLAALMAVLFVLSVYITHQAVFAYRTMWFRHERSLRVLPSLLWLIFIFGILSNVCLLELMPGDALRQKYFSLVLFRAQNESLFPEIKNFVTANLFTLTQTFAIFSILGVLWCVDRKRWIAMIFVLTCCFFFGSVAVSRRIYLIEILLLYFSIILFHRQWHLKWALGIGLVGLFFLAFGRQFLWFLGAQGAEVGEVIHSRGWEIDALDAFSSLGISLNSSWATLLLMDDMPLRFGIDHLFSVLRFLPLGSFGIDEDELYGARIVRVSTETIAGPDALDIPPGLIGQMWLDFGWFGAVVWGVAYGAVIGYLDGWFGKFKNNLVTCGVFSIIVFVLALPLNSGSLDFNFSPDIFFLIVFIFMAFRVKKITGTKT